MNEFHIERTNERKKNLCKRHFGCAEILQKETELRRYVSDFEVNTDANKERNVIELWLNEVRNI